MLSIICIDPTSQLPLSSQYINELTSKLTVENKSVQLYLQSINSLLYKAILTTRTSTEEEVQPFTVNNFVAPGKKNETQPKFHSTCKKPGRKKQG